MCACVCVSGRPAPTFALAGAVDDLVGDGRLRQEGGQEGEARVCRVVRRAEQVGRRARQGRGTPYLALAALLAALLVGLLLALHCKAAAHAEVALGVLCDGAAAAATAPTAPPRQRAGPE